MEKVGVITALHAVSSVPIVIGMEFCSRRSSELLAAIVQSQAFEEREYSENLS